MWRALSFSPFYRSNSLCFDKVVKFGPVHALSKVPFVVTEVNTNRNVFDINVSSCLVCSQLIWCFVFFVLLSDLLPFCLSVRRCGVLGLSNLSH